MTLPALLLVLFLGPAQAPSPEPYIAQAERYLQQDLYAEACQAYEKALALDPRLHRARFHYGVALMGASRNREARTQFLQVLKGAGPSPHATYYLGRLDLLEDRYADAIKRLEPIAARPPYPDTALYLGIAYQSSGDADRAARWLEQAARLTPRDYRVHYRLARAYSELGRDDEARREYSLYTELSRDRKGTEKEVRACAEALRSRPAEVPPSCAALHDPQDPAKLIVLGQLYGEAGAFAQALKPLEQAARLDPQSFEAWHNLGLTLFRLQRLAEARPALEKAVALRPESFGSTALLGAVLYMSGEDAAAIPVLERANRLNPADRGVAEALAKLKSGGRK